MLFTESFMYIWCCMSHHWGQLLTKWFLQLFETFPPFCKFFFFLLKLTVNGRKCRLSNETLTWRPFSRRPTAHFPMWTRLTVLEGSQVNKVYFHRVHGGTEARGVLSEQVCTCRYGKLEDPYVGMGAGTGGSLWTTHGHVQACSLRDLTCEQTNWQNDWKDNRHGWEHYLPATSSADGNNNCIASSPATNSTGESFEQKWKYL